LIDLARYYSPRPGAIRLEELKRSDSSKDVSAPGEKEPSSNLDWWTEFHEQVARLPEEEREVFELKWYHRLKRAEVAMVLGLSETTVRYRWLAARLRMRQFMQDRLPA
jgi:RNA polymerase sigma factor (sigma-70 family)